MDFESQCRIDPLTTLRLQVVIDDVVAFVQSLVLAAPSLGRRRAQLLLATHGASQSQGEVVTG